MQQLFPFVALVEPVGLEYFLASWNQVFLDFLETGTSTTDENYICNHKTTKVMPHF